ncbi:LuxR C-terminal-related transcriptional regulator [Nocardia asteroides]|uniref:LuxR C-terminal-related transcriptional regulator n=1 Tax=Nocardia asteroides TaxID=1824 RepID=UPI001E500460|nr:LuxR C-terminal-related transcriptional regulator [Nocardia asteroides]UGT59005.1 helix-turn-helix transcriptional regulator [Nocardia asteroides]
MAEAAFDTLPIAREILRELEARSAEPTVYLVRGRSGTGKSTLLAAIRAQLRSAGIPARDTVSGHARPVHTPPRPAPARTAAPAPNRLPLQGRPAPRLPVPNRQPQPPRRPGSPAVVGAARPQQGSQREAALVIDNAHTLGDAELLALCRAIDAGQRTVVIAAQPRPHDQRLRRLADTVARRGRVVELRALGAAEIVPFARELGMVVPRSVAQHIHQLTGGNRGGVVAALAAASTARLDAGIATVDAAVTEWARSLLGAVEPDLLETLAVATTGTGLDSSELVEVLGVPAGAADALIDRARASALVTDADLLLDPAIAPLRTLLGDRRFVAVQRRLLSARLDAGLLRDHTALLLAESGVRDARLADFLCHAAEKAGAEAVRYYRAAVAAGTDPDAIALPWAEAALRAGDGETALRLAEPVLARLGGADPGVPGPADAAPDLATAVRICATVLVRRGRTARAAQLYGWLGPHRAGADWATGAAVQYLAGDAAGAATMSASARQWPPTEANAHTRRIVEALARTVTPRPDPTGRGRMALLEDGEAGTAAAVSGLIGVAHAAAATERLLPCAATTIATLLCLSIGEPRRAIDALRRSEADGNAGPQPAVLAAWAAMLGGDERTAADRVAAFDHAVLEPRDRLLAHGVAIGLARRSGDHTALTLAWEAAVPLFDEVDADLLTLLPIGELWLAGIRLRDERRIAPLVAAGYGVLRRLGEPPAWANAFHWYGVQAALAQERPDDLLPHAGQLRAAAEAGDRHAAVLAQAGRTWVLVLRGEVAAVEVEAAVAQLAALGLTWDAARLASEAALAARDPAAATALLKLARTVRADARPADTAPRPRAGAPAANPVAGADTAAVLSEREREVAELVLLGLTYREIGARLYISAKTVEHHVARIRRRIGAQSRSELLSMLRAMGHGSLLV